MLIESAFLKLPELMLSSQSHQGNVEAMVVQQLVNGLQMELNCRSIPFAYNHITVEKPYPKQSRTGTVYRADLLFESGGTVPSTSRLDQYGFKEKQWLEAKSFFSRGNSSPPTTQNIGRIIKDMIRLCLLPEEYQGSIRQNGRYVLLIFDKTPSKYLAFSDRAWLKRIFKERAPSISVDLSTEKSSLVNSIANVASVDAQIDIALSILHFEPSAETPFPVYWGYLLRIDEFSVSINGKSIESGSEVKEHWDRDKVEALQTVRDEFVALLKSDEGDIISASSRR